MSESVSGSALVEAPPETVWALVADVTRMGEWSPETVRCTWVDGATGPELGAAFKGDNKRGLARLPGCRWPAAPRPWAPSRLASLASERPIALTCSLPE